MLSRGFGFLMSAVAAATLIACGDEPPVLLTGAVIDGYIEGATVCLDENGDGKCGATEPSSVTDKDGKYSLVVSAGQENKFILVDVPATAKDSDDGGRTLAAAGKSAYIMSAPASLPQVVSPLTTLMVGKIKADGLTLSEARVRVLDELGLPAETDLHSDHVKAGDVQVHAMARQFAARLQETKRELGADGSDPLTAMSKKLKDQNAALGEPVTKQPAALMNIPNDLALTADGKLLLYSMISATGKPIVASAMLFTPKAPAPQGGRPLIVIGAGTTGIAGICAPSNIMQGLGFLPYGELIKTLIGEGFAVVMPDYEGRGPAGVPGLPDAHPYLHVGSAGNAMVLSAVASKRLLGSALSGAWAAWGHSQGGHAALAAAQFAGLGERLEPSLDYRGAIAVAPASHFAESVQGLLSMASQAQAQAAFGYLGTLGFYASYIVQGSRSTASPLDPNEVLGAQMKPVHSSAGSDCLEAYFDKVQAAVTSFAGSGGQPSSFGAVDAAKIASPKVLAALRSLEPGRVKLPGKTLLLQGSVDTTVLPVTTQALEMVMKGRGSDVSLTLVSGDDATHSGVLDMPEAQQAMLGHIGALFGLSN